MDAYIIAAIFISLIIATLGMGKNIGFWGVFFLSLLFSPLVAILVIIFSSKEDSAKQDYVAISPSLENFTEGMNNETETKPGN